MHQIDMKTLTQENQRLKARLADIALRKARSAESNSTCESPPSGCCTSMETTTLESPVSKSSPMLPNSEEVVCVSSSSPYSSKPHLHPNFYSDNIRPIWEDNIPGSNRSLENAEPLSKVEHSVKLDLEPHDIHPISSSSRKAKRPSKIGVRSSNFDPALDDDYSYSTSKLEHEVLGVMEQTVRVVLEDKQGELNPSNCYKVMYKYAQAQVELRKKTTELKLATMRIATLLREAEEKEDARRREAAERESELEAAKERIADLMREAEEREAQLQREAAEREAAEQEMELRRVAAQEREAAGIVRDRSALSFSLMTGASFVTANSFSEDVTSCLDKVEENAGSQEEAYGIVDDLGGGGGSGSGSGGSGGDKDEEKEVDRGGGGLLDSGGGKEDRGGWKDDPGGGKEDDGCIKVDRGGGKENVGGGGGGGGGGDGDGGLSNKEIVEDEGSCVSSLSCGDSDNALPDKTETAVSQEPDTKKAKNNQLVVRNFHNNGGGNGEGILVDPFAELITSFAWGIAFTFCIIYQLYLSKPVPKVAVKAAHSKKRR